MGTIIRNGVAYSCIPGPKGETGNPGPANSLSIGSVIKGSTAGATITGTSPNQTLNLVLPKGDTGATGPANTLSIGTVTSGTTPSATITGTAPNQTLNLVLAKGDKGDTGNTGATGPANTLSIGTVTKGDTAAATITGTAPSQTLNLTLPKGDKGDKGDTGATGPQGLPGTSGWSGKNLFKFAQSSGTSSRNGITVTVLDSNRIKIHGKSTANSWWELVDPTRFLASTAASSVKYFELDKSRPITLSVNIESGTYTGETSSVFSNICYSYDINGNGSNANIGKKTTVNANVADGIYRLWLRTTPDIEFNNCIISIQIEYGSTATSYEPYNFNAKGREIVNTPSIWTGKNIFISPSGTTPSGITVSTNNDGSFNISGTNTASGETTLLKYINLSDFNIQNGETYTASISGSNMSGFNVRFELYNNTTWKRAFISVDSSTTKATAVINTTDANRMRIAIAVKANTTATGQNVKVQLEKGSTVTSYEPYFRDNLSRPISNLADPVLVQDAATKHYVDTAIDIGGYSGTIANLVKNIYPQGYCRWLCGTDGGSSAITDKPTGNVNSGFELEAYLVRDYSGATDWKYRLVARLAAENATFEALYVNGNTSVSWSRVGNNDFRFATLWTGTIRDTNATATLSQNYTNFKFLAITHYVTSSKFANKTDYISVADITQTTATTGANTWNLGRMQSGSVYSYCDIIFTSNTQIKIIGGNKAGWAESPTICRIQGIR